MNNRFKNLSNSKVYNAVKLINISFPFPVWSKSVFILTIFNIAVSMFSAKKINLLLH
jgi:hypothetical protein